jgi:hypothetical protein
LGSKVIVYYGLEISVFDVPYAVFSKSNFLSNQHFCEKTPLHGQETAQKLKKIISNSGFGSFCAPRITCITLTYKKNI